MISLCMISRKEDEDSLLRCLESVAGHVGEIVIVDTSKGEEKLAADRKKGETMSSDYGPVRWFPFEWTGDFAAARNFSFSKAKGDVILWLDSDDTVAGPENLAKLAKAIADGDADWIVSKYNYHRDAHGLVDAFHWKPRLFRAGSVSWEKTVHEVAVPTEGVIQSKDTDLGFPIVVEHRTDEEHHRSSAERNLAIMMAEYERGGEDTDPRTFMYIGMALDGLGRCEEAIGFYRRLVEKSGSDQDRFWSIHRTAGCLFRLGDYRDALSASLDALKLFPGWQTAYFDIAAIYHELEEWEKVAEWTLTGLSKEMPDVLDVIDPLDYRLKPQCRLAEAFLWLNRPREAMEAILPAHNEYPSHPLVRERYDACVEAVESENFVRAFLRVAGAYRKADRLKAAKLFADIPSSLDSDWRIQRMRSETVPPRTWKEKEVAIYCGDSPEDWAYPSIFTGIGGSEEAVINMSIQLAKRGYSVTVYNRCGNMRGVYPVGEGGAEWGEVEYLPYYHFNPKDRFDVLIGWRTPGLFVDPPAARKRYLWLHDALHPEMINARIVANVDKVLFLSKWHSGNVPVPAGKAFVTNNGIDPEDFRDQIEKRPNSLIWSSSYDRGLLPFMENIWPVLKAEIPDLTIDVAYGWQNIDKELQFSPALRELRERLTPILESTPGLTHHGRLSHRKLAKLMGSSVVYPYASEFGETNNITSQKCQMAGCWVVTTSGAGGTSERVVNGTVVDSDRIYSDAAKQLEFAGEVKDALSKDPIARPGRKTIAELADMFSWSATANQWAKELL